jgi:hypothetical protein
VEARRKHIKSASVAAKSVTGKLWGSRSSTSLISMNGSTSGKSELQALASHSTLRSVNLLDNPLM